MKFKSKFHIIMLSVISIHIYNNEMDAVVVVVVKQTADSFIYDFREIGILLSTTRNKNMFISYQNMRLVKKMLRKFVRNGVTGTKI